jgi:hypothetical protein
MNLPLLGALLRPFAVAWLALVPVSITFAASVGNTEAEVLETHGEPTSRMSTGAVTVLNYPDQIVRIEDDAVVSVRRIGGGAPASASTKNGKSGNGSARSTASAGKSSSSASSSAAKNSSAPAAAKRPSGPPLEWVAEYRSAVERAASSNRPVFLFFTGSNWCTWCKKLEGEILETTLFRNYAAKKLVLLKLDFPRGVQQPEWMIAQNQALSKKYRVTGYPTVVMLSPTGKFLANLGYAPGGPVPFVAALQEVENAP